MSGFSHRHAALSSDGNTAVVAGLGKQSCRPKPSDSLQVRRPTFSIGRAKIPRRIRSGHRTRSAISRGQPHKRMLQFSNIHGLHVAGVFLRLAEK
jgi:hypothetical protein